MQGYESRKKLMSIKDNEYDPDCVTPPGFTIIDCMIERNLSVSEVAKEMDESELAVIELISGSRRLGGTQPQRLADAIGGTPEFWVNRECQYLEHMEKLREGYRSIKLAFEVMGDEPVPGGRYDHLAKVVKDLRRVLSRARLLKRN